MKILLEFPSNLEAFSVPELTEYGLTLMGLFIEDKIPKEQLNEFNDYLKAIKIEIERKRR